VNPATALATVVVDELCRNGVRHAVLAPGSRSAPLAMAFAAESRMRLHVEIDERSAAFLAVGIGRATGRPAVVVTTSGTAVANLLPAVVEADASCVPLVVLSADRPPELRDTGANQTIDQLGLFGRYVRAFTELGVPEDRPGAVTYWRSVAARSVARAVGAAEGPSGPVHVNVPMREPLVPGPGSFAQPLDGRDEAAPWTAVRPTRRSPDVADVDALRRVAPRRGVLVLGDGADAESWSAFAAAAGWPVLAEPLSGGRRPGTISTYDLLLRDGSFAAGHRPEVAVVAGRVALSKTLRAWLDDGVEQLLHTATGRWLDPSRTTAQVVAADAGLLVEAALGAGVDAAPDAWAHAWRRAEAVARAAVDDALDGDDRPSEPRTARDLADALPDGGALVVASSMPVRDLDLVMRPRGPLAVLGNRGASGIDGFVSTAMGVASVHDAPVAALAGDLSLLHDQNGFLLAQRPDLPIVVVNNDGGGIFSFLPQAAYPDSFERVFGTPHGIDLARLAATYGLAHTLVERASDLSGAVTEAASAGGTALVEVRTDRDANVVLHRHLFATVARALRAADVIDGGP
jgi:2-succinyl-5-enolpyruvyl-6-hydroxy-3-cyclohexene-1-carboxylate synthase